MILVKVIKPARMRDDRLRLTLLNAIRKAGTQIKKDFEGTTKTWKHKPKFETVISLKPSPTILVGTNDEVWNWVNEGTGGAKTGSGATYPIWAGYYTGKSEKKTLAFPSVSTPKTTPGSLTSGPGSSGGETVFTPYVEHPGIKPRKFTKQIKEKREKWFKQQMQQAMKDAARASGYGK